MSKSLVVPCSDLSPSVEYLDSLSSLQAAVGGFVESVGVLPWSLFVNEDGKSLGLPVNVSLNRLLSFYGEVVDPILGPVVLTGLPDSSGELTDLTAADITRLMALLGHPE